MKKRSYKLLFLFVILSILVSMGSTMGRYVTSWTSPTFSLSIKASMKLVLKFDANGGNNAPSEITVELEDGETEATIIIPDNKPSKNGSIFAGWKAPDEEIYNPGDEIILTENVTLTAIWETRNVARVYDIFYNGSGFYADPNFKNGIRILSDNSIDITGDSTTEVTKLSALNGTTSYRTSTGSPIENYNIWFNATYTPTNGERIEGKYILRRYTTERFRDALLLIPSGVTTYFNTTIDGNKSANTAYYLNNSNTLTSTSIAALDASYALIRVQGTLNMTGGSVQNNSSYGTYEGGAGIAVTGSGRLNMSGGIVQGNKFLATQSYNGSGISSNGANTKVTITGGTITNNTSTMSGGGIAIYNGGTHAISNCIITNNTASGGGGAISLCNSGTITLRDCTITGNRSSGSTSCAAIYLNSGVTLNIYSTVISNNTGSYAGGIYTRTSTPRINLYSGTQITGNKATRSNGAGGIYGWSTVSLYPSATSTSSISKYVYSNTAGTNNVDIYLSSTGKYYTYTAPAVTAMYMTAPTAEDTAIPAISQYFQVEEVLPEGVIQEGYHYIDLYCMPSDAELENQLSTMSAKADDGYSFYGWRIVYGSGSEIRTHDQLKGLLAPLYAENPSLNLIMYPLYIKN